MNLQSLISPRKRVPDGLKLKLCFMQWSPTACGGWHGSRSWFVKQFPSGFKDSLLIAFVTTDFLNKN